MDIRTEFPDGANPPYVPTNYDGKEHGLVSVRSALANSYNIPAVKTLQHIGIERLKNMAERLGITTLTRNDYGLSLTLGGGEVTLLELTGAYATLANNGKRMPVSPVACVFDASGALIWSGAGAESVAACKEALKPGVRPAITTPQPQQVVDPRYVFQLTSILADLEARRPAFGNSANLLSVPGRPSAAKTGTTNDYLDGWTLGYTPDLAIGVWVGNADRKPMQQVAGSIGAAPIWQNVMAKSLEGTQPAQFAVPQGIQQLQVCTDSGTQPSEACPNKRNELFTNDKGPLPARFDLHQRVRVDRVTNQLATEFTPADRVEDRNVMMFPPRYRGMGTGARDASDRHGRSQLRIRAGAVSHRSGSREPGAGDRAGHRPRQASQAPGVATRVWGRSQPTRLGRAGRPNGRRRRRKAGGLGCSTARRNGMPGQMTIRSASRPTIRAGQTIPWPSRITYT